MVDDYALVAKINGYDEAAVEAFRALELFDKTGIKDHQITVSERAELYKALGIG